MTFLRLLPGVLTSSPPRIMTCATPCGSWYTMAAWLNRLAPPTDCNVLEPVAPAEVPTVPSELMVAYEFSLDPVPAAAYSPADTKIAPPATSAECLLRAFCSALAFTVQVHRLPVRKSTLLYAI